MSKLYLPASSLAKSPSQQTCDSNFHAPHPPIGWLGVVTGPQSTLSAEFEGKGYLPFFPARLFVKSADWFLPAIINFCRLPLTINAILKLRYWFLCPLFDCRSKDDLKARHRRDARFLCRHEENERQKVPTKQVVRLTVIN